MDCDLARDTLALAAELIMEAAAEAQRGASMGARWPMREIQFNEYRERDWDTRTEPFAPDIPRLRTGTCLPNFLKSRRIAQKALVGMPMSLVGQRWIASRLSAGSQATKP